MELILDDLRNGYIDLVEWVMAEGKPCKPRDQDTLEIVGASFILNNPFDAVPTGIGRNLNLTIGAAETCHLVGGLSDPQQMVNISGTFGRFTDDNVLKGAYGPRIFAQLPRVIQQLSTDSDSRQAVATIWREDELSEISHDVPCTISLHWMIRDGALHATTHMRSNDCWLGIPYDAMMFTRLQIALAWALGVGVGTYRHLADSFHLYLRDLPKTKALHRVSLDETWTVPPLTPTCSDTHPGERSLQRALTRFQNVRKWAISATLNCGWKMSSGAHWYAERLRDSATAGVLCTQCRQVWPATEDHFYRNVWSLDGKQHQTRVTCCKHCEKLKPQRQPNQQKNLNARLRQYGVTQAWYDAFGNKCAICMKSPNGTPNRELVIDHDALTGVARGVICNACNRGLGFFKDNTFALQRAVAYLEDRGTDQYICLLETINDKLT